MEVDNDVLFVEVGSDNVVGMEVDRAENDADCEAVGTMNEISRVVNDMSVGRNESNPMGFEYFSSEGINLVVDLGELCGSEKEVMLSDVQSEEFKLNGINLSAKHNEQCVDVNMEGVDPVVVSSGADKECKDERLAFDNDGSNVTVSGVVGEHFCGNDCVPNFPLLDERENGTGANRQSDAVDIPVETCMANYAFSGQNGMGVSNNQNAVFEEQLTCARSNDKVGYKSNIVALTPKAQSQDCLSEQDGEYFVGDMVWGKVRGHPWWPGQIFEPSAASTTAKKHFKKGSYLVAYFGDQTFAWNESTTLKPFHTHYVQMAKQSNLEAFCEAVDCALQEVSRRVEYGLSCSCFPMGQLFEIESQTFINAGIRQESSKIYGIGKSASSFAPIELLQDLELIAADPFHVIDKLRSVTVRAQLLAFNHWKGFSHLPDIVEFDGLGDIDADNDIHTLVNKSSVKMHNKGEGRTQRAIQDVSSLKCKHISDVVLDASSIMVKSERKLARTRGRKKASLSSSEKSDSDRSLKVGERVRRVSSQLFEPRPALGPGVESSQIGRGSVGDNSTNADEILSKLCLAAASPMKGHGVMKSIISFLSHYRNTICLEHKNGEKRKRSSEEPSGEESSKLEAGKTYDFVGIEDLYWTDRTIQSNLEEQELLEHDNQLGAENLADLGENAEDYTPTELILKFSDLETVPSITELNKIFSHYGPLDESQSVVFSKSKRAKVVFKRRSHAETAFSSAGKFRIFGHSLLGYCLKASTSSARNRKAAKSTTTARNRKAAKSTSTARNRKAAKSDHGK